MKIGVAITDHNEIQGCLNAHDIKGEVMIIPGIEISCKEGPHMLTYFYELRDMRDFFERFVKPNRNKDPYGLIKLGVGEILEALEGYSHISSAAHPFGTPAAFFGLMQCINKNMVSKELISKVDAFEVICGSMGKRSNKKSYELANLLDKPITGGSDGHLLHQLGKVISYSYANDVGEFLDNIRKQKNIVVGKETGKTSKLFSAYKTVRHHILAHPSQIKLQYVIRKERRKLKKEEKEIKKFVRKSI